MKRKMNKKGQLALYIVFLFTITIIIVISAIVAPLGVDMTAKFYEAGQGMMADANDTIAHIQDRSLAKNMSDVISAGVANTKNNIEVFTALYKYGWILALVVITIGLFLYTRRLVEYGGGLI
jgi:predicted PurR-regulated permease PerM